MPGALASSIIDTIITPSLNLLFHQLTLFYSPSVNHLPSTYLYHPLQILSLLKEMWILCLSFSCRHPKFQGFVSLCSSTFPFIISHLAKSCVSCKFFSSVAFPPVLLMGEWRSRELTITFLTFQHKKLQNLAVSDDSSLIFLEGCNVILL